jgi:hypothetical protein
MNLHDIQVAISAPNQTFIGISDAGNLIISGVKGTQPEARIDFGPATKSNFDNIISYFKRLKIHATDADT